MNSARLFGDRPQPAAISVVEPSMLRWYAHRARLAFFATWVVVGVATAAVVSQVAGVSSPVMRAAVAILAGGLSGAVAGFVVALVVRAWPVLRVLWWWSLEIAMATALLSAWWLVAQVSPWLAAAVLVVLAATGVVVRRLRRRVVAWGWCVVVRHRLRLCFAEFIRSGAQQRQRPIVLPLVLWARPTPAGERVWVWLRPGLDLADLDGGTGRMAVACWAGEVRVCRVSTRYAALIRVDIARRDPLQRLVSSPLARQFSGVGIWPADVPAQVDVSGLDLDDVPEPVADERRSRR